MSKKRKVDGVGKTTTSSSFEAAITAPSSAESMLSFDIEDTPFGEGDGEFDVNSFFVQGGTVPSPAASLRSLSSLDLIDDGKNHPDEARMPFEFVQSVDFRGCKTPRVSSSLLANSRSPQQKNVALVSPLRSASAPVVVQKSSPSMHSSSSLRQDSEVTTKVSGLHSASAPPPSSNVALPAPPQEDLNKALRLLAENQKRLIDMLAAKK